MSDESVLVERRDGIGVITVNRPEKLNALNDATLDRLAAAAGEVRDDGGVRAVIVTGAGEKAFVAGADIAELRELDASSGKAAARKGQETFGLFAAMPKPVIAAVGGFALGGGCELALACHIRLASEGARFGLPEVKLGIIPGYGGTQRLVRIVGLAPALQMILTGEMIDAREAHRIGLVTGIYPAGDLLGGAEDLARKILSRGPVAVRLALEAAVRGSSLDLASGLGLEADLFGRACGTRDKEEGMAAFLEKRPPSFRGE